MAEPLRLYGLKAIVTKAGSGIGEAVARTLAKHGATVLAIDSATSPVEQVFRPVKGVEPMVADLGDAAQLATTINGAVEALGGIDILVCNLPLDRRMPIEGPGDDADTALRQRNELTDTICRSALPHLKKSPCGRIISVGYLRSEFTAAAGAEWRRAETELATMTRNLAQEIGEFGITANYVQPGGIMTPASREAFRRDLALRDYCISNSAARRLGEPVDVAKVVLFLASDDAVFVSGTGIAIDGGLVAP
jgi:NAD(P)-dependent dehydrogenase (short-subunit alcohol dehydrogenase family)